MIFGGFIKSYIYNNSEFSGNNPLPLIYQAGILY